MDDTSLETSLILKSACMDSCRLVQKVEGKYPHSKGYSVCNACMRERWQQTIQSEMDVMTGSPP